MECIGKAVQSQMKALEAGSTTLDTEKKNTLEQDKDECGCGAYAANFKRFGISRDKFICPICQPNAYEIKIRGEEKQNIEQWKWDQMQFLLAKSGLPPRMLNQTFENFTAADRKQEAVMEQCRGFVDRFQEHKTTGKWLIFSGPCGTGKGHLASAIAQGIIELYQESVYYVKLIDLVGRIKDTWSRKTEQTEEMILEQMRGYTLLILDEIGVQFGSEAERLYLYRVLDNRYEWLKPTIMTTNLTLEQLKKVVGPRVFDRMQEPPNEFLLFNWPSYRRKERQ